eukprot:evm.model.NODE_39934_length_1913_cov_21.338213.1
MVGVLMGRVMRREGSEEDGGGGGEGGGGGGGREGLRRVLETKEDVVEFYKKNERTFLEYMQSLGTASQDRAKVCR